MLNISKNKLNKTVSIDRTTSGKKVFFKKDHKHFNRFLIISSIIILIVLFLPWTQNVRGRGTVTTLSLEKRPQTVNSQIPGRIEKWFVKEGDTVYKGDTIAFISEVKSEYWDPDLIPRTALQIEAKKSSVNSYVGKVDRITNQIKALKVERDLKIEQANNKLKIAKLDVESDSIGLEAAQTNIRIAQIQYDRDYGLWQDGGLKATKDVEEKKLKLQEAQRKLVAQENKLLGSRNKVINAKIELNRVQTEFINKISKAESDRFTAESSQFDTEAQVTKLENAKSNYVRRNELYYITAPQDGYINTALRGGIGQTFKEGEALVRIMPINIDIAVETFVEPIDLPLMHVGERIQIQFDGWPAIVFSGWPNTSFGTFTGKVVAIESYISTNGKYRIVIAPDPEAPKWPDALRAGAGAATFALLEDVPVWYEIWRQLNGFPPNYYQPEGKTASKDSKK